MHTFTTEADITLCSKYTTTIVVHSWPYLYNCIVKKVSPQYVVWSTYAMYSLCTLYCSTINVKILYVQNIDLSPSVCMYYKLYTILYLIYNVSIELPLVLDKMFKTLLRTECILIRSTRNPRQNPERDEKREKEKKRRRILFMVCIK